MAKAADNKGEQVQGTAAGKAGAGAVVAAMQADHARIEGLFAEYAKADAASKPALVRRICDELIIHIALAEEIVYPAMVKAGVPQALVDHAHVSHDSARHLIEELMTTPDGDRFRDAKVSQLARTLKAHLQGHEEAENGLFAKAGEAGLDDAEIAARMAERRKALEADRDAGVLEATPAVTFQPKRGHAARPQEDMMDRNGPDRDERGRFVSDDDHRGGRAMAYRSGGGGSRYEDDDRGRRGGYRDDDDRGYGSRGGSGRDHGQGGWFGDPQGHSQASRMGWEHRRDDDDDRGNGRSMSSRSGGGSRYEDDDRGRRGGYRDDDDRGYGSRGGGGRDHGQGGWFGDPQGHSQASRMGWEHRRDDDDDRGRGRGSQARDERGRFTDEDDRSRYGRGSESRGYGGGRSSRDDDDYRGRGGSSRDHGQGGWFGDSEGHAEASRRGWEHRR